METGKRLALTNSSSTILGHGRSNWLYLLPENNTALFTTTEAVRSDNLLRLIPEAVRSCSLSFPLKVATPSLNFCIFSISSQVYLIVGWSITGLGNASLWWCSVSNSSGFCLRLNNWVLRTVPSMVSYLMSFQSPLRTDAYPAWFLHSGTV